jgi:hypothetical protein
MQDLAQSMQSETVRRIPGHKCNGFPGPVRLPKKPTRALSWQLGGANTSLLHAWGLSYASRGERGPLRGAIVSVTQLWHATLRNPGLYPLPLPLSLTLRSPLPETPHAPGCTLRYPGLLRGLRPDARGGQEPSPCGNDRLFAPRRATSRRDRIPYDHARIVAHCPSSGLGRGAR